MNQQKSLAYPAYLLAAALFLLPLAEILATSWPLRFGTVSWRFGAAGLVSSAVLMQMLGALIAVAVAGGVLAFVIMALLFDQRVMQRVLLVLCGMAALVLVGMAALFLLDALQMRGQVRPQLVRAFDVATLLALTKQGVAFLGALGLGFALWRSLRAGARHAVRLGRDAKGTLPLIVSASARAAEQQHAASTASGPVPPPAP